MKFRSLLAIVLIIVGFAIFVYRGLSYVASATGNTRPAPTLAEAEKNDDLPILPMIGVISLTGGIFLAALNGGRKLRE